MRSRLFYQRIKTKVQLLDSGVEPVKEQGFFQLSIPLVNSYESRHFFIISKSTSFINWQPFPQADLKTEMK